MKVFETPFTPYDSDHSHLFVCASIPSATCRLTTRTCRAEQPNIFAILHPSLETRKNVSRVLAFARQTCSVICDNPLAS